MKQALSSYLSRNVPRYTSYPTAPHFQAAPNSTSYKLALSELPVDTPISLYLHVPFCRQLCWYCGCNMKLATRDAPIAEYARTLRQEIRLLRGHLPGRMRVSHVHWGGGTPTALVPDDLARTMELLHETFDILPDAEIAIEADPRTLTEQMIARIGELAITRASFGVQEFDPKVQAAINRIQPPEMVQRAVDGLRRAGVKGINFDLIYGLPHQTKTTLEDTIARTVDMAPDRIALFGYAHVPWVAKRQRLIAESALPDADARLMQATAASQALIAAGYASIGLDHFARPNDGLAIAAQKGTLRRNFQGYTTDSAQTLIGMGATSIGRTPSSYFQNVAETGAWARSVSAGELPVGKHCKLSQDDLMRADVIEAIMCQKPVNLRGIGRAYGQAETWYTDALPTLAIFEQDGLVKLEDGILTVLSEGAPLLRVIASAFDRYFKPESRKHAAAV